MMWKQWKKHWITFKENRKFAPSSHLFQSYFLIYFLSGCLFFSVLFLILLLGICNYEFFLVFDFFNFFLLTSGFHSFNFFRKDISRQVQAAIVNFVYLKSVFGDLSNKALAERKFHWWEFYWDNLCHFKK